jgi:hypothetical protein
MLPGQDQAPEWLEDLLADPVTKRLVGKKIDIFAAKWRNCFGYIGSAESLRWHTQPFSAQGLLGNFSWLNVKSFIWPSILGIYWLAYRKLYGAAFAFAVVGFVLLFVPPRWQMACSLTAVFCCLWYAPAIYLCHIRDRRAEIKALSDPGGADALIAKHGGTSILAVLVAGVAFFGLATLAETYLDGGFDLASAFGGITKRTEISSCNDGEVKRLLLQGTLGRYKPMATKVLELMKNGPEGKGSDYELRVQTVKTLDATIENITQLQYDSENDIRVCGGKFRYTTSGNLQTLSYLTLMATMLTGRQDMPSLCKRDVTYQIQRLQDKPTQIQVQWRCG